jgi:ATP-binding cassette subfamily C (CFTR/MRP) protein 4
MTSVERVLEYTNLPSEEKQPPKSDRTNKKISIKNVNDNDSWPSHGEIVFENVSFGYDPDTNLVLKDLTFRVKPGEKVGIVGRTGAGKSSIIQTLFRMAELTRGRILIDNVNIVDITLAALRQKLSIIPQEPVLFSGSIRSNLDPYGRYSDEVLWNALERVRLKQMVKEMNGGLDSQVEATNLSVGQRQLVCVARAIVKKVRIVCIDEATANIDFK